MPSLTQTKTATQSAAIAVGLDPFFATEQDFDSCVSLEIGHAVALRFVDQFG